MKYDDERFYVSTASHGMEIGCHVIGARQLVQKLIALAPIEPSSVIAQLRSLGTPDVEQGPMFWPAAVQPDNRRDVEWLKRHRKAS